MKVILIATGETVEVNDSYGSRLFEQGKAVPAPKKSAPAPKAEAKKEEPEAEPKEKPKTTAKKKE